MSSAYKELNEGGGDATGSGASRDPFYVVKDKVVSALKLLKLDYEKYKEMLNTTNTSTNSEFQNIAQSIRQALKKLRTDLTDLSKTIDIVEKNRVKFKHIDDAELDRRKVFVNDTKNYLQEILDTLQSDRTKKKLADDKARSAGESLAKPMTAREKLVKDETDQYVNDRMAQHQQLIAKQDLVLDDMNSALARLGDVAESINIELDQQQDLITDINQEVDDSQNTLDIVNQRLTKILGSSDKGKLCCILFLFLVVVILFFIIIYG